MHWILDVGFVEDDSRTCQGHSAENLAVIRHIGVNLLSKDKKTKVVLRQNDSKLAGMMLTSRTFLPL